MSTYDREETDAQFIRTLSRHLVGICWGTCALGFHDEIKGEPRFVCATSTMVTLDSRYYLVTAGHIIKDINKTLADRSKRITCSGLYNAWARPGVVAEGLISFDFSNMREYHRYDRGEGVDFGMILLEEHHAASLLNTGTQAFQEHQIGVPSEMEVEQYWLLGIPEELQQSKLDELEIEPNVFRVMDPCSSSDRFFETEQPRIFAHVPEGVPLTSLNGMSGGPLFAFIRVRDGYERRIAGLQSGWNKDGRIIAASTADVYLNEIRKGKIELMRETRID